MISYYCQTHCVFAIAQEMQLHPGSFFQTNFRSRADGICMHDLIHFIICTLNLQGTFRVSVTNSFIFSDIFPDFLFKSDVFLNLVTNIQENCILFKKCNKLEFPMHPICTIYKSPADTLVCVSAGDQKNDQAITGNVYERPSAVGSPPWIQTPNPRWKQPASRTAAPPGTGAPERELAIPLPTEPHQFQTHPAGSRY